MVFLSIVRWMKAYAEYVALPLFVSVLWSPLVFCKKHCCASLHGKSPWPHTGVVYKELAQSEFIVSTTVCSMPENVTCLSHKQEMTLVGD